MAGLRLSWTPAAGFEPASRKRRKRSQNRPMRSGPRRCDRVAMSTLRRIAHTAHPLAAATVVLLVFVQVYLIAAYIFGEPGALDTHMTVGRIAVFFELIVLLTALIGWRSDRSEIWMSVALFLVGDLQASLAKDIGNSPWVHALHGMFALVVLVLASLIAVRSWREAFPRPALG